MELTKALHLVLKISYHSTENIISCEHGWPGIDSPDSASYMGWLSLLVLCSAPRGFSPGTPVFPSPQKPKFDLICSGFS